MHRISAGETPRILSWFRPRGEIRKPPANRVLQG